MSPCPLARATATCLAGVQDGRRHSREKAVLPRAGLVRMGLAPVRGGAAPGKVVPVWTSPRTAAAVGAIAGSCGGQSEAC